MKKVFFFLLFSGFCFGQNVEYLKKMNDVTKQQARQISDSIASFTKNKYVYFETDTKRNDFIVVYLRDDVTEEEKKQISFVIDTSNSLESYHCDKCLVVAFKIMNEGENKDLEIKGREYLSFKTINGKFLDLFPFWKNFIDKDATTDKTYEVSPIYSIRKDNLGIWYNFVKTDEYWYLRNMSDRINEFK